MWPRARAFPAPSACVRAACVVAACVCAACVVAVLATPARAQPPIASAPRTIELTPYVGYRIAGNVHAEDATLAFDDGASVGASLEYVARPGGRVGLLYARQSTTAVVRPTAVTEPGSALGLTIQWAQLTASTDVGAARGVDAYVVASVGGAYLDPDPTDAEGDWSPAGTVGAGLRRAVADRFRARLEGRLLGTVLDASSRVFCSLPGACAVSLNGEILTQFDVSLGLSLAF